MASCQETLNRGFERCQIHGLYNDCQIRLRGKCESDSIHNQERALRIVSPAQPRESLENPIEKD
jgi:hypothetical protein